MPPPEAPRVLVMRTSRFMSVAASHAHAHWPGATLRLLCQDGAEADAVSAGIAPSACVRCPAGTRIGPLALVSSVWGWRLLAWRPDVVVLQWWRPDGRGHEGATLAALLLQPRGCDAVFEDGRFARITWALHLVRLGAAASRWCGRIAIGGAVVAGVSAASMVLWPAAWWFAWRERMRRA